MHTRIFSTTIILWLLIAGCQQNNTQSSQPDIETITQISKARADAFNKGDASTIALYFAPNCFLMAPGKPTQLGKQAVEAYYQSIFSVYHTQLESKYESVVVDGNLAYGRGVAKVTLISKDGKDTVHSRSKYLNILERSADGEWLTTHDIWNDSQ